MPGQSCELSAAARDASIVVFFLFFAAGRPALPGMPPPDDAATRIIPFYSLRLGDLVVPRATLVIQCRACSRVSRVSIIPVLSKFGHRYGVRDLEQV